MRGIVSVSVATFLIFSGLAFAQEQCPFCNASVRFDEALATCFEQQLPSEVEKLSALKSTVAVVNLAACGDEARTRGGLPTGDSDGAVGVLDASFMVTSSVLNCLGAAVAQRQKPLQSAQLYVIAEICP